MRIQYFYFGLIILCFAVLLMVSSETEKVKAFDKVQDRSKIINFSHQLHVEFGIMCVDCHTQAPTSRLSTDNLLAMKADCAVCHDVTTDCLLCHVSEDVFVEFQNPPRDIYFNHELHYTKLGISCETCHAGVEEVDFATADHLPDKPSCMSCHDGGRAAMDCESCHKSTKTLLPASHMVANFDREHKRFARAGAFDAECASCHMVTFCQDCHDVAGIMFSEERFMRSTPMYSPEGAGKGAAVTQRVHDLNYKFTHGIDARAKSARCQTCHQVETFCAECHFDGGGISIGAFKPRSHDQPGFVLLGGGGGRHAELARRDIESCMTCHDLQGRDPSCMLCHAQ